MVSLGPAYFVRNSSRLKNWLATTVQAASSAGAREGSDLVSPSARSACASSAECNTPGTSRNFCAGLTAGGSGFCLPRSPLGGSCYLDDACSEGACVGATATTAGTCT